MLLAVVLAAPACRLSATSLLKEEDAGPADRFRVHPDAGRAANADAGDEPHDAGDEPEAGETTDAGNEGQGVGEGEGEGTSVVTDAGTPVGCSVPLTLSDFVCDGTEDYCDPVADVAAPQEDILATWSRFDGSTTTIDILFSAMPFTVYRMSLFLFVDPNPFTGTSGDAEYRFITSVDGSSTFTPPFLPSGVEIDLGSSLNEPPAYPPSPAGPAVYPETSQFDYCNAIFLGTNEPLVEFRLPMESGSFNSYFAVAIRDFGGTPGPGGPSDPEYLFSGESPAPIVSRGGSPPAASLSSLCSITCSDIGGESQ
jgi:hypothetical protein